MAVTRGDAADAGSRGEANAEQAASVTWPSHGGGVFATDPAETLFGREHTAAQLACLRERCMCPTCGERPGEVEPLPDGWLWDCAAFTYWAWCPACLEEGGAMAAKPSAEYEEGAA